MEESTTPAPDCRNIVATIIKAALSQDAHRQQRADPPLFTAKLSALKRSDVGRIDCHLTAPANRRDGNNLPYWEYRFSIKCPLNQLTEYTEALIDVGTASSLLNNRRGEEGLDTRKIDLLRANAARLCASQDPNAADPTLRVDRPTRQGKGVNTDTPASTKSLR